MTTTGQNTTEFSNTRDLEFGSCCCVRSDKRFDIGALIG